MIRKDAFTQATNPGRHPVERIAELVGLRIAFGHAGGGDRRAPAAAVERRLKVAPAAQLHRKPGKPRKRVGFAAAVADRGEQIDVARERSAERGVGEVACALETRIARVIAAFFDDRETKFANGVLDAVAKEAR